MPSIRRVVGYKEKERESGTLLKKLGGKKGNLGLGERRHISIRNDDDDDDERGVGQKCEQRAAVSTDRLRHTSRREGEDMGGISQEGNERKGGGKKCPSLRDRKSDRQSAKKPGMHATKARLT